MGGGTVGIVRRLSCRRVRRRSATTAGASRSTFIELTCGDGRARTRVHRPRKRGRVYGLRGDRVLLRAGLGPSVWRRMLRGRNGDLVHDKQHRMPVIVRVGPNIPSHDRYFAQTRKCWFLDELHVGAEALGGKPVD